MERIRISSSGDFLGQRVGKKNFLHGGNLELEYRVDEVVIISNIKYYSVACYMIMISHHLEENLQLLNLRMLWDSSKE